MTLREQHQAQLRIMQLFASQLNEDVPEMDDAIEQMSAKEIAALIRKLSTHLTMKLDEEF